jgi:2-dehydro-3-deoxyphosphogluconate aldolase/(4S)-4-hydroxy-2-oxoglutarate aldolase
MMIQETLERIHKLGLLAVIRASSLEKAVRITDALVAGGVTGIEITFTTPDALDVVRVLAEKYGDDILLGMGTLTEPEHAAGAKKAGSQFLVSPHVEQKLAGAMRETGLPFMMGALTPSEIVRAKRLGSHVVKLFPSSLFGPRYLKSLGGPYPDLSLMPTGGVNLDNLADWFAAGAFAVGVGSALFPSEWVKEGRYEDITRRAELFGERIREFREAQGGFPPENRG